MTDDTTSTRRTRADLRAIATVVADRGVDGVDEDRRARLRAHGWLSSNDALTGNGTRVGGVVDTLDEREMLDLQVDMMGFGDFVDAATARPTTDALAYMAGVRTLANLIDEARHQTETQADEFDHDGTFAPHFVDFDARDGTVEVRFKTKAAAAEYLREWVPDRYDAERKHDHRFKTNRNPRRIVVHVL